MKLSQLLLCTTFALTTTHAVAFDYIYGVNDNYDRKPLTLGMENPDGTVVFLDFIDHSIAFEGYSEPNFRGEKVLITADNQHMHSPYEMKSFKIVETDATSYKDTSSLYLFIHTDTCIDISYQVPSLDIGETEVGQYCPESSSQKIMDFSSLSFDLKATDKMEFLIKTAGQSQDYLASGFSVYLGENNLVKATPEGNMSGDRYGIRYESPNYIAVGGYVE